MHLTLLTGALFASAALSSPALAAPTCDYDGVDFPAQTAQAHPNLVSVAKALLGRAAPRDEAAAAKALKQPSSAASWAFQHDGYAHAVIKNPKDGYWLLSKIGGTPVDDACNGADVSLTRTGPSIVRIQMDDAIQEEGCQAEFNYWDHFVIDDATGVILVHHHESMGRSVGPDGPDVTVDGGALSANGDLSLNVPLKDLRACATPSGLDIAKAAKHWLSRGRKATKAKAYEQAMSYFNHALAIDAKLASAHSGLGYARLKRAKGLDLSRAVDHFKAALKLNPDPKFQGAVWFNIGTAHWEQVGPTTIQSAKRDHFTKAREAFATADRLRPSKTAKGKLAAAERALAGLGGDTPTAAAKPAAKPGALCEVAKTSKPTKKAFASVAEMARATLGQYAKTTRKALCAQGGNGCDGDLMVLEGELQHNVVVVDAKGGAVNLDGVFSWWSGAFCAWAPDFTFDHHGDLTIVSMVGEGEARWEGECSPEGQIAEFAVIDRKAKTVIGQFDVTSAGDKASLKLDGSTLRFSDGAGKHYAGTVAQLRGCSR